MAILHASELRELEQLTWGELREQVAAVAAGLRALGVGRGDRVVAYMPNIPEAIIAFLATAAHRRDLVELLTRLRRRQRHRSLRPDRAQGPLRGRWLQLWRQATLTAAGSSPSWQAAMPSLEHTVVLPYLDPDPDWRSCGDRCAGQSSWATARGPS